MQSYNLNIKRPVAPSTRSLLRAPGVLLILGITAAAQVALVSVEGVEAEPLAVAVAAPAPLMELAPALAEPDPAVKTAWLEKAVLREADRLGANYRSSGYNVSPALASKIGMAAAEFDIEPDLAFGLVRAESSFRNQATSRVGAVGLTQLMPRTAAWIEPGTTRSELRDPDTNLRVGFKYLRYLIDKYDGNEKLALLAYNRGPGTVDRALKRGRNPDNGYADYVYGRKNHGHRLFTR